jgi:membrane-bound lytic murein transglycosylase A
MTLAFIPPLPEFEMKKTPLDSLPDYGKDHLKTADQAWAYSCIYFLSLPAETPCLFEIKALTWQRLARLYLKERGEFRTYLTRYFDAYELCPSSRCERLFTGYYEPELKGSLHKTDLYPYPVHRKPSHLVVIEDLGLFRETLRGHRIAGFVENGTLVPTFSRQQIQEGALDHEGLEICWVQDALDLYFMHIQGGGKILFEDGSWTRLQYDGTNGYAYCSLGQAMIARGLLSREECSMEKMKETLRAAPDFMPALLSLNPSYVFFRDIGMQEGPVGRMGQPLTSMRSLAVDPRVISLGMPLWLSSPVFSGFMVAQDVGGAIKGLIRGDIFCGTGDAAGVLAGGLKEEGRLFILLPKESN